jgi:sacsin
MCVGTHSHEAEKVRAELELVGTAWQCRVCLTHEVAVTLIPCGHVLCNHCTASCSRCPFCRAQCTALKLFR